ncbi:predicted GPI-anchored protein 58 [Triticum dicoccoides]|uniref:predicted GPI-anchored protein 58 n=1 Tax=Triticum dicoccoides TaxID=85692 RepID=UPI00188DEE7B|nr:predicted GPI-anchored protein 58 [Triticum dicoccoides]
MAAVAAEAGPMMAKVALECGGDISASQEDVLAKSPFLGAANAPSASASASQARGDEDDEEEVFATPPELPQQEPITMCSLPFTPSPSQPHSPSPPPSDDDDAARPRRRPRVCTRKVRGAKFSTPAPAPTPTPSPKQQPEQPPRAIVDPLYRAMLMIPTATAAGAAASKQDPLEDFLALARQRGIF